MILELGQNSGPWASGAAVAEAEECFVALAVGAAEALMADLWELDLWAHRSQRRTRHRHSNHHRRCDGLEEW